MSRLAFTPLVFLIARLSTWVSRGQQRRIDYLVEENRILKAKLGKKRILLTD